MEQILGDVVHLGSMGERVLAFADLELDAKEFDISPEEPQMMPHDKEVRECDGTGVFVIRGEEETFVPLACTYKKGKKKGETKDLEDHNFGDLYKEYANLVGVKAGSLRLTYGQDCEVMKYYDRLGDHGMSKGSVLYAY